MGLIKFEVDVPEFEKELTISVTIRKDGEVLYTTSTTPSTPPVVETPEEPKKKKTTSAKKVTSPAPTPGMSGNLMNLTEF